jgi:YfiH family protein
MTVPFATSPNLASVPHGFFGREGGVSTGPFATLNVSDNLGDDLTHVANNRAQATLAIGFSPEALVVQRQVHSSAVTVVTQPPSHAPPREADAIVTDVPGLVLGILTADCAPILFADPEAGVVGAAHAGWKGAASGIAEATVLAMVALGADPSRIHAAIGPTISGANYEVGPDFAAALIRQRPDAARRISRPGGGREHFDLPGFLADQLAEAGVGTVSNLATCTYADRSRWFSHRRATHEGTTTGRQISLIGLRA